MARMAREVIDADVDDDRITWRKGWSNDGVSNVLISELSQQDDTSWSFLSHELVQPLKSLRSRAKADISGLSCMLLPFFPRSPQRLVRPSSTSKKALPGLPAPLPDFEWIELLFICSGVRPWRPLSRAPPPPRMAETDDCAQRACFLIAEVTVMHSVVIRATGSTAMEIRWSSKALWWEGRGSLESRLLW